MKVWILNGIYNRRYMLLKLKDYERIYRAINSIIKNEDADPSISCIFFSAYGSYILSKHYKIDATPKAGLAAYHIGFNNDAILFGEEHEGSITGERDAFHCWVEADGWVIDFMSPAFPQLKNINSPITSKMFQKPLSEMASSISGLRKSGDFYLESTPISTAKHMQVLSRSMAYSDLAEICAQWYKKPPKKIPRTIAVGDAKGNKNPVHLIGNPVVGAW